MKYLFLSLIALVPLALAQSSNDLPTRYIDYGDCTWYKGSATSKVNCPAGYVGTGACANKGQTRCDDSAFTIECCKLRNSTISGACEEKSADKGRDVQCNSGSAVFGTCSSLDMSRCDHGGNRKCITINCCPTDLPVDYTSCDWYYKGNQGERVQCSRNAGSEQVMTGRCGSETMAQCDGNQVHGIRCCDLV